MKFLEKLQNLPEGKRRIILWIAFIFIGLALLSFQAKNTIERWDVFKEKDFKKEINFPDIPDIGKEIQEIQP